MKYLERLKQKQTETTTEEENLFLVESNSIQLKADALATDRSIYNKKKILKDLLSQDELNSVKILNAQDALQKAEDDKKALTKLIDELF